MKMEIGKKIKILRQGKNLTQDELALRCELSKSFISQLERDLTSPSISTLVDILESLGVTLKEFFSDDEEEKIVFSPADYFEAEDENLGYKVEWIIPNAQKNIMEPIMLTLSPGGTYKEENAHEGEEFGYVLAGNIVIKIGSRKYRVHKGESFCYKPSNTHCISNPGKTTAKIIWVSSPPSF
ncbi:MAG: cupin domain-containing protein [Ruminococcaceae bacterium]|nr:cupin domain-containing protein [Oscillospiraceae bacterium]